eukprot:scaffold9865_cov58-Cyclotella_meneghiniana.AAC.5
MHTINLDSTIVNSCQLLSHVLLQPHGEAEVLSELRSLSITSPLLCDVRVEKGPRYLNVEEPNESRQSEVVSDLQELSWPSDFS